LPPNIYSGIFNLLFSPVGNIWRLSENIFHINKGSRLIIYERLYLLYSLSWQREWNQVACVADNVYLYQASCPLLITANSNQIFLKKQNIFKEIRQIKDRNNSLAF
jgi:hypothetical protein